LADACSIVGSQYRLGQIYELKGEERKAIHAYEEFLSTQQARQHNQRCAEATYHTTQRKLTIQEDA